MAKSKTVDITTNVGIISFPRVFPSTKTKKESDGSDLYDIQYLIPKSDREGCRNIMAAIKEVGIDAFGDPQYKKNRIPLRDGDKEADNLASDNKTLNRDKYPERLGHYFFNAKSGKPVGVYDAQRNLITEASDLYGGCKAKIAVTFYAYNSNGNVGVGASLNGVQKIADGTPFGSGRPSLESMFDVLDIDDDMGLDDEEAPVTEPAVETPADDEDDLLAGTDEDDGILDDLDD